MAKYLPIAGEATDLPINEIVINSLWAGLVIESLTPLRSPSAWAGTPEEIQHCIDQIDTIQDLLMGYDLTPPHISFTVIKGGGQTVTANTFTILSFAGVNNNTGGGWDGANNRFVAPIKGFYSFIANVQSTGLSGLQINVNGAAQYRGDPTNNNGTIGVGIELNAGQYVQVLARTTGTVIAGTLFNTFFSGHLVYSISDD